MNRTSHVSAGVQSLSVNAETMLNLSVQCEDNKREDISIPINSTISDLIHKICPSNEGNIDIEAYGVSYTRHDRLSSILEHNPRRTLLVSTIAGRHRDTPRDIAAAADDLLVQRNINELIAKHWEKYNHHTCTLFSFMAAILTKERKTGIELPSYNDIETKLMTIKQNPEVFFNQLDQMIRWDTTGGDCSTSHIELKRMLQSDSNVRVVQWTLRSAHGEHTCLTGVSITGSLFLVDVGIMRTCLRFDGMGVSHVIPTIGVQNSRKAMVAEFQIVLSHGQLPSVKYKI